MISSREKGAKSLSLIGNLSAFACIGNGIVFNSQKYSRALCVYSIVVNLDAKRVVFNSQN